MDFFVLNDPCGHSPYASFAHRGTWSEDSECEGCGSHSQHLVEPLLVEWDEGSVRIGSFSWCSYTCIVTDDVRHFLEKSNVSCEFGTVQVVRPEKRTKYPRVPFPYFGPTLHWLSAVPLIDADVEASGLQLRWECPQCGRQSYDFKREGLVVRPDRIGAARIFQIRQLLPSNAIVILKDFLLDLGKHKFVNLEASFAGVVS